MHAMMVMSGGTEPSSGAAAQADRFWEPYLMLERCGVVKEQAGGRARSVFFVVRAGPNRVAYANYVSSNQQGAAARRRARVDKWLAVR